MYSVRPSSPPSMHAKQPRSAMTVSSTSPPSATRVQRCPGTLAYQIAPSASAQMPSGAEPGPRAAQTRRSTSSPASVIVQAVSRSACDSATTSVSSPRTTIPFGNHTSSATWRLLPSGSTTVTIPGLGSSHGIEPGMSTHARPAASTTISLKGCAFAPYGSRSGPATNPAGVVATSRPSGSQSIENGSPSTRATTSRFPSASKTSTSPASQSHIQNRPSCQRGDSPIWIPVAKTSVIPGQTPAAASSHRTEQARARRLVLGGEPGGRARAAFALRLVLVPDERVVEVGVEAAGRQQVAVGAPLDHPAGLEHEDLVGRRDRGQAVGDDQAGPAGQGLGERPLHGRLVLAVEMAGRLVEDHHRRVLEQHAGDGDALLLA